LAATLLIRPQCSIAQCAQLSFVTAVAAAQALRQFTTDVEVKWPNDILVRSRKIAGILLETAGKGTPEYLAIGVGINLANHPDESLFPATSLAALGVAVPAAGEMLSALAASFARWYEVWSADGFGPIRTEWLTQAARLGEPIRARMAQSEMSGVFEGIDESGALLLRQEQHTVTIAAADVYFGN
jgi:BirA family biotin operon repressor/biotin-[acetyl-CoA-carboxylase] ligase